MTEVNILLPCGRMVQGHPMNGNVKKDNKGQPKLNALGEQIMNYYHAVAIPKNPGETHWTQTEWGLQIYQTAVAAWPRGEHGSPTFAWKIADGDDTVPDKSGKSPSQREGWPGHWVLKISAPWPIPCYHAGHYQPHEVIQDSKQIKTGDYVRTEIKVKGNESTQSPGMYLNPVQMELSRAGQQIISDSMPDAASTFGGSQAVLPQNAMVDNAMPQQGMPQQGMPQQGMPQQGMPQQGMPDPSGATVTPGQAVVPPVGFPNTVQGVQPAGAVPGNGGVVPNPNYTNPQQ